jgi:hypothetical protein
MAKRKKRTTFTDSDRRSHWFVDRLDPNRPMRRTCSRNRWIDIVNALVDRDEDGTLVHREASVSEPTGVLIIRVGTPEWQDFLRDFIYRSGFRMCWDAPPTWEPRRPEPSLF